MRFLGAYDWLLSSFSSTKSTAMAKYDQFVEEGRNMKNPWTDLKHQIYLGSDNFISKVASYVDTVDLTEVPSTHIPNLAKNLTIEEYEQISANRDEGIYRSYNNGMYSMKEIGKHFGLHYSRISRIIKKLYEQGATGKI
jgi:hypothetical protein